ncbi:MAG: WG repeat-containing protein [Candidatus Gracilibacteria bacterium]|nr:WG repeat-containing protein [Candidatus Gracilibacteria bacterium]
MSENKKDNLDNSFIRKEEKNGPNNEKVVRFQGNLKKFENLNSKIQSLNSLGSKELDGKQELIKILNWVLKKHNIGGENGGVENKVYFSTDKSNIVLVFNSVVNGVEVKSSADDINNIVSRLDSILKKENESGTIKAERKILKYKNIGNGVQQNIEGINNDFKKNSTLFSDFLDNSIIMNKYFGNNRDIYVNAIETSKDMLFRSYIDFLRDYSELKRSKTCNSIQLKQLESVKRQYETILKERLKDPKVKDLFLNHLDEIPELTLLGINGTWGLLKGTADAAVIAPIMMLVGGMKFLYSNAVHQESRDKTGEMIGVAIDYYKRTKHKKLLTDFFSAVEKGITESMQKIAAEKDPGKQAEMIGNIFGQFAGSILGVKGFGKLKKILPLNVKFGSFIEGFEKVFELNKVKTWKDLNKAIETVSKVRGKTGMDGEKLMEILKEIEKGNTKLLKDLPEPIKGIATELSRTGGLIVPKKGVNKVVNDALVSVENNLAKGAIKATKKSIEVIEKFDSITGIPLELNKKLIKGTAKIMKLGLTGIDKIDEGIIALKGILGNIVGKPINFVVKEAGDKIDEIVRVLKVSNYPGKDQLVKTIGYTREVLYKIKGEQLRYQYALAKSKGKNGLYGFKGLDKKIAIDFKYSQVSEFSREGFATFEKEVEKDGKRILQKGIINHQGVELLSENCDILMEADGSFKMIMTEIIKDAEVYTTKQGFAKNGKIILDPVYDRVVIDEGVVIGKMEANGKKIFKVIDEETGALISEKNIEISGDVILTVDRKAKKFKYIKDNSLFELDYEGKELSRLKFKNKPESIPGTNKFKAETERGTICIMNNKNDIVYEFKGLSYENIQSEHDFLMVREGFTKGKNPKYVGIMSNGKRINDLSYVEHLGDLGGGPIYELGEEIEGKLGFRLIDKKGDDIIKGFRFDKQIYGPNESDVTNKLRSRVIVQKGGDYYMIDIKSKEAHKLNYIGQNIKSISQFDRNGFAHIEWKKGGSSEGLLNFDGKVVVKQGHSKALTTFSNGKMIMQGEKGKKFIVDKAGRDILAPLNKKIKEFKYHEELDLIEYKLESGYTGIVNGRGEAIVDVGDYSRIQLKKNHIILTEKSTGFQQLYDVRGEQILKKGGAGYKDYVICGEKNGVMYMDESGNWGIIGKKGEIVANSQEYKKIVYNRFRDIYYFEDIKGKKGFFNGNLERSEILVDSISNIDTKNGKFFLVNNKGKYGLLDKEGNVILEAVYDEKIIDYNMGFVVMEKDGIKFATNSRISNKTIIGVGNKGEINLSYVDEGFIMIKEGDKYGVVNLEGRTLFDTSYDIIDYDKATKNFHFLKNDKETVVRNYFENYREGFNIQNISDFALLENYKAGRKTKKGAERVLEESKQYIGDGQKNIIKALENSNLENLLEGFVVGNSELSKNFEVLLYRFKKLHSLKDVKKELSKIVDKEIGEFIKVFEKRNNLKLSDFEVQYMYLKYKPKIEDQFMMSLGQKMNKVSIGEKYGDASNMDMFMGIFVKNLDGAVNRDNIRFNKSANY